MKSSKNIFILTIKFYQKLISPFCLGKCKFVPTCSNYTIEAILKFGIFKGLYLSFIRICKCNHFSKGGYDPVPENLYGEYRWLL